MQIEIDPTSDEAIQVEKQTREMNAGKFKACISSFCIGIIILVS